LLSRTSYQHLYIFLPFTDAIIYSPPPAPCPPGKFSDVVDGKSISVCKGCPMGTYSSQPGSSSCSKCLSGTFSSVSNATSISTCLTCGAGTYSDAGASSCAVCPAGSYSAPGAASCSPCTAGTFSTDGASACTVCPVGTFASTVGSTMCLLCSRGIYNCINLISTFPDICIYVRFCNYVI
jgi:hypothetical protein